MKKLNCILLVDDDEGTNLYHEIIIDKSGMADNVQICIDGRDALDYLTNQGDYAHNNNDFPCPELILLDINMPGMNGFEFLDAYQSLDQAKKGKQVIVMLSTSLNEDDEKRVLSYEQVSVFKNKPLSKMLLQEIAQELC